MLRFVTKEHYWNSLDNGIENKIKRINPWHLKSIQDAVVADYLVGTSGKKVAEIGGGDTRILEWLASNNEVFNIETFEGEGNGPIGKIEHNGVNNIYCMVGDSENHIEPESFDIIFSVSVVEHIPNDELKNFVDDCWRILKPGGIMIHAVDMYVGSDSDVEPGRYNMERLNLYNQPFDADCFHPLEKIDIPMDKFPSFQTTFATNPDSMMRNWNRMVPQLAKLRAKAQSVSLMWGGKKI